MDNQITKDKRTFLQREEQNIDLLELATDILQHWWIIVLAVIAGLALGFAARMYVITPQYQTNVMIFVNNTTEQKNITTYSSTDKSASRDLVNVYIGIVNSRAVLNTVIDELELDYSVKQLQGMVTASSDQNTPLLKITVTGADPEEIVEIANEIARVLPDIITDSIVGTSVSIIDYAVVPDNTITPGYRHYMLRAGLVLFVLAVGIIVLMSLLDDHIYKEEEFIDKYRYPLLASIPDLRKSSQHGYGYSYGYGYGPRNKSAVMEEPTDEGGAL